MARQRTIVGLGALMLADGPDGPAPAGVAATAAREATRLGQVGELVSRLGQDSSADTVLAALREQGVGTSHVQSDPDLPTARFTERTLGTVRQVQITTPAAFDNLQWDFDLTDLAQVTDAVVLGPLAARQGQTRSVMHQFLAECGVALTLLDLSEASPDTLDRSALAPLLGAANMVLVDDAAIAKMLPGADGAVEDTLARLNRDQELALSLYGAAEDTGTRLTMVDASGAVFRAADVLPASSVATGVLSLMVDLVAGGAPDTCLARAVRAATWSAAHPEAAAIPADALG